MDLGKIFAAVKIPLIISIVLGIIGVVLNFVVYSSSTNILEIGANPLITLASLIGIIGLLVIVYAGYLVAKKENGSLVDAGLGGAIVAVISGIISGIINMFTVVPLMGKLITNNALGASIMGAVGPLSIIIGIIGGLIIGFILGLIGGAIGGMGKKK